ncbi:unnamed protein product [Enterobius vermicularis]|uniref:CARMIL_C domain-containing protein n=1 Tax=Enterobius vermicularis TaxID=51028 RepID=A0A0N4VMS8_ENTVE|nr:unnamed protein product [Enterobius vermicularis]
MSAFWGRLNAHRPSLAKISTKDSDEDENCPPETKNEVFELFAKSTKVKERSSRVYGSDRDLYRPILKRDLGKQSRKMSTLPRLPKNDTGLRERSASPQVAFELHKKANLEDKIEETESNKFLSPTDVAASGSTVTEPLTVEVCLIKLLLLVYLIIIKMDLSVKSNHR